MPDRFDLIIIAANARSLIANRGALIADLLARGAKVGALVPEADYLDDVETLGIPIWKYPMQRTGISVVADLRTFFALYRLLRRIRPASVFSYTVKPIVFGVPAARLAGVRRAYSMVTGLGHTYTTDSLRTRVLRAVVGRLYRTGLGLSTRVFFQNPDDEAEFVSSGILRDTTKIVRTAGSGIDLERFARQPLAPGPLVFLLVSRLLTEKGIAEFVAAATELTIRWPEARFVVVGPHDRSLPHAVPAEDLAAWQRAGVVEFIGGITDVRPWLAECSVLVHPSYREGTPRAVLEAMSVGRPIITTDAPGCRETVEEGVNGFLVPPRTVPPLAAAMERFLKEPAVIPQMANHSRRIAEEKYEVRKVNQAIMNAMALTC